MLPFRRSKAKLDEIHILKGEFRWKWLTWKMRSQGLHSRQTRIEEEINGVTEFIEQRKEAIKEAEGLIKKYEKQSGNVKNNREFEAINKEIEMQQLEVKLAEKHIKDATEEIAEKGVALEKAKKNISAKEGVLSTKKGELEKIIAATEKEEKHFNKLAAEAKSMLMNAY